MLKFTLFWFRRDLRLDDNVGLLNALKDNENVLPIFIFDPIILKSLEPSDRRVNFIHQELAAIKSQLNGLGSDLNIYHGEPLDIFREVTKNHPIDRVYTNHDYEPYARERDARVRELLEDQGIEFHTFKDQVIFEKSEILTGQKTTYTVFTPYKKNWLVTVKPADYASFDTKKYWGHFAKIKKPMAMVSLKEMGFNPLSFSYPPKNWDSKKMKNYQKTRDIPSLDDGTSRLGLHLRFGTISVRACVQQAIKTSDIWLSELIWREFFMQILWHFPGTVKKSFRAQYENIEWRNNKNEFEKWAQGKTGYPLVDAGMRELVATGHMHNRVRMVVASFLTKHLLTHWYLGERFFATYLLDYDLSANNGNWQWAAGTGCDAAPYFRVFNPTTQIEKFDPDYIYIKKWVPEFGTSKYLEAMVEHKMARDRAIESYKKGLSIPLKDKPDVKAKQGKK